MAAFSEETVTRVRQCINGVGKKRQDPAYVGNDDIDAFGKMHLARITAHKKNFLRIAIRGSELAAEVHDAVHVNRVDATRASLTGQQGKDSRSTTEMLERRRLTRTDCTMAAQYASNSDLVRKHHCKLFKVYTWLEAVLRAGLGRDSKRRKLWLSMSPASAPNRAGSLLGMTWKHSVDAISLVKTSNSSARWCLSR